MPELSARTEAARHPVVYAGRLIDRIADSDLPDGCIVLGEQAASSHRLTGALNRASRLLLLDLVSFPVGALAGDHWDVPMILALPSGFDAESLISTFGSALFERLGFFDRLVTPDPVLWEELRQKYGWAEGQHVPVAGRHPSEAIKAVYGLLEAEVASRTTREVGGVERSLHFRKALHRVQAASLEPRVAAAWEKYDTGSPLDVLEVGAGAGRWVPSFDPAKCRYVGLDVHENLLGTARGNFPGLRFDRLGPDLLFPYESQSFDLVFSVTVMHHNPTPAKRTLLSEMWRVAHPGGRLIFLENFVFTGQSEGPAIYPMSATEFANLALDATAGQVVLDYVESLRYPGDDLRRGGLISLLRLGVPKI